MHFSLLQTTTFIDILYGFNPPDENYDFNYQQSRILKDEMTILPGDSLITECYYDASKQNAPSFVSTKHNSVCIPPLPPNLKF